MGKRSYPPLKLSEVISIIQALNFTHKRTKGSHAQYEGTGADGTRKVVTVDLAESEFHEFLIKSMIRQCGHDKKRFYGATEATAAKIR